MVSAKKTKTTEPKITGRLKVTQMKSVIGTKESHRACVRGLGLRRINHTVDVEDTPAVRGMINKVFYLVKCEA
ncbi:MAG: 50S ribosomal protein L30 [Candidatus Nitrotoga sp.]